MNERLFDTMFDTFEIRLFETMTQFMKKQEKIVVYKFNIGCALIFRELKIVSSNLTLDIPN